MQLTHSEICARIPHAGAMCLLDGVRRWDAATIDAVARSHRDADNPLRAAGVLNAVTGVEYAAQAMAVHGGLLDGGGAQRGFLASVRDLRLHRSRLDDIGDDLEIHAERLSGTHDSFIYSFIITAHGEVVLSGRTAVKLLGGA